MEQYVALDVSLKEISICIIDSNGDIVFEGKTVAEPATLVELIRSRAPQVIGSGWKRALPRPGCFMRWPLQGCRSYAWMRDMPTPRCRCGLRSRTAAMPEVWPTCCGWTGIARCTPKASPRTSTGQQGHTDPTRRETGRGASGDERLGRQTGRSASACDVADRCYRSRHSSPRPHRAYLEAPHERARCRTDHRAGFPILRR